MHRESTIKFLSPWAQRHAQAVAWVRFASGCWLLLLTAILYGYHRAGWWTPLLVLTAAAHFYLAYRLRQLSNARGAATHAV